MADNITAPAAGVAFATDEIGGVHHPKTLLEFGVDGEARRVSAVDPLPVGPAMAAGGNIAVATANPGTGFAAFTDQACKQLTVVNNSGVKIEFRQGGAGVAVPIFDQAAFTIFGLSNASQIEVRRIDQSNTPVNLQARWEA